MFGNYLTIALRNIARHKLYSFINIAGLAVGLTCAILIMVFIRDELSYDAWIPGSADLWRVEVTFHPPGIPDITTAESTPPLTLAMRDRIPEVRSATRLAQEHMTLGFGDRQFTETIALVDPNFLQVVRLPLVAGDPRTVLSRPENLVISESAAKRYFGEANPIGKILTTGRGGCADVACANTTVSLKVTGVMADLPHNTQFAFDFLMPTASLANRMDQRDQANWLSTNHTFGYLTLAPGADPAAVLSKLKPILDRSIDISALTNVRMAGSKIMEVRLTPFLKAHMTTDRYRGAMRPPGSWTTLYGMGVIGVLILLVACFNFMNLATARATMRAREISLRKCMGARRAQLMVQFLGEAVLMALFALALAFALVEVLLPVYSQFMGRPLAFHYLADWPLTMTVVAISVAAGLLSGLYPALVLSDFRPAVTLRVSSASNSGSGRLRAILVVLQFAVSIGLGIGALVVFQQIQYARQLDLGFNRDNIIIAGTAGRLSADGIDSFQRALERAPGILAVARSNAVPFDSGNDVLPVQKPGAANFLSPNHISVSPDYFSIYRIRILAGRVLSDQRADDRFYDLIDKDYAAKNEGHNVMVNAALTKTLGETPATILGKSFIFGKSHMTVVGVAADTLVNGARSPVQPLVYVYAPDRAQTLMIRVQPGREQEAMASVKRISRAFIPGVALSASFLDDTYERLYRGEKHQGEIFAIFVAIAISIACLGLFGLAAFTAGRRNKEIGIRKVFGARVFQIVWLLLTQFSTPVLLANLIAWPIAWYYLNHWLQGFAYRITLSPLYFVTTGLAALLIAWATIFVHALRVARANPIHALRHE
jgi:putative ABC transport system permease protein